MLSEVLLIAVALFVCFHQWFNFKCRYWVRIGVAQQKSNGFPFGNNAETCADVVLSRVNAADRVVEQYKEFHGAKIYGLYGLGARPILVICDPELIKCILGTSV
jgi:hypothetical protein